MPPTLRNHVPVPNTSLLHLPGCLLAMPLNRLRRGSLLAAREEPAKPRRGPPPALPPELLGRIAHFVAFAVPGSAPAGRAGDADAPLHVTDSASLLACALVCRQWAAAFLPALLASATVPYRKLDAFAAAVARAGPAHPLRTLVVSEVPLRVDLRRTERCLERVFAVAGDAPRVTLAVALAGPLRHRRGSATPRVLSLASRRPSHGPEPLVRRPIPLASAAGRDYFHSVARLDLASRAAQLLLFLAFLVAALHGTGGAMGWALASMVVPLPAGVTLLAAGGLSVVYFKVEELREPIRRTLGELERGWTEAALAGAGRL
ncbi:hypothetical protein DFJ74DRAFT_679814 [Hyaloraphidium curvatum]|nr:hypothetical protein DFJ74DRAFT_679814 [Hyaloraphidium curvatum]